MSLVVKLIRLKGVHKIIIFIRWEKGEWFKPGENIVRLKDEFVNWEYKDKCARILN